MNEPKQAKKEKPKTIMERYAERLERDVKAGLRYPGILPKDRAELLAYEEAQRRLPDVVNIRTNC